MNLSEASIRRPLRASMISAALVLFGVIVYTRLSVRQLPDIDPPIISVSTTLPGANAQVVETAVTDVLEEELSTIQGLRTLSSSSSEENSQIILEFNLDRPVDVAAQDVRDKVSRVRGRLPVDVLEPVIAKQQADAQPFFWLALSSPNYDLMQLSDVADRLVKARLQSLAGGGSAGVVGARPFGVRVWVQAHQRAASAPTVQHVHSPNARRRRAIACRSASRRSSSCCSFSGSCATCCRPSFPASPSRRRSWRRSRSCTSWGSRSTTSRCWRSRSPSASWWTTPSSCSRTPTGTRRSCTKRRSRPRSTAPTRSASP